MLLLVVIRTNAAPTGAGKTTLFELAIMNLFKADTDSDVKVVYIAPTKVE
jgi:replicative superfamily II helicase